MNPPLSLKREDWSRRIPALVEKHFLEAGFGVVEMAAVGPIFEERRLEAAGLTGHPESRVKLQTAFWLVDGGCEWVESQPPQIAVGLRVQRVGGAEERVRFTNAPGEAVEKELLATLARALASTNLLSNLAPDAEADLLAARGMELATRRSPFQPRTSRPRTQWDAYKQELEQRKKFTDNRDSTVATYKRTLQRDPRNLEAKTMLGYALLGDLDAAERVHGKELLHEVIATGDSKYAGSANQHLSNAVFLARAGEEGARPPRRPNDWQSLDQAFEENPSDLETKCDLGAALLKLPRASERQRGQKMLAEVAAGDHADQADRARRYLAEAELSPAIADNVGTSASTLKPVVAKSSGDSTLSDALEPEDDAQRARREFLQKQFAKFVPVRFEKDGPQLAKFQRVPVKANMFDFEGKHYCGFRFTTPEWLDGDLQWMHILAKTEAQKDFSAEGFGWYIIPKSGRMEGFETFNTFRVASYPQLTQRFPYTRKGFRQDLRKEFLKPGQEYAIWFHFNESDLPDISFALSIQSRRGQNQFGLLPLR